MYPDGPQMLDLGALKTEITKMPNSRTQWALACFDCFPLCLHVLTSLIKLILWLKFFHRKKARTRHRWNKDHRVPLYFKATWGSTALKTHLEDDPSPAHGGHSEEDILEEVGWLRASVG